MASGRFVTFCYARIDVAARRLTYANAGHNPPLLMRANGAIDQLAPGGTVLGVFAESTYEQGDFAIAPGRSADLLHRRHHRGTQPRRARSSARSASPTPRRAIARCRPRTCSPRCCSDIEAFNGGVYEDDATLIVAAL